MPGPISKHAERLEREQHRKKHDIRWLKHVEVIDMLEQLNIENISQATVDEVLFSCPFSGHSNGDEKPSCYMNDGSKDPKLTTVFHCKGCNRSGNAISFLAEHMNISRQRAANELKEHYAPGFRKPKYGSIQKEFDERRKSLEECSADLHSAMILDWSLYQQFEINWSGDEDGGATEDYMLARGFNRDDLATWKIGYDYHSDRVTIPVFDAESNFIGVKARAIRKERKPKYLNLGDREGKPARYGFVPYEKSLVVFGLDKWGEQERYVFVEGEIDVISLWKMGIPAMCTGGVSMSSMQAQIIKDHCDEVVLFLDPDLAGVNAVYGFDKEDGEHKPGIIEVLEPFVRVRLVGKHQHDANDYLVQEKEDRVRRLIDKAIPSFKLNL